jgi:CHAT domain-containing protein
MNKVVPVLNAAGDWEENVERLARHLGQSKLRRTLFNIIYGKGSKPKSKKQIVEIAKLGDGKLQLAQNELEHLYKHQLVARSPNDGIVDDGSRHVYAKAEFVRANREAIVRRADNKALADRTPTKRRPAPLRSLRPLVIERKALRKRRKLVVLYLTASPHQDNPLRVEAEVRMVQEAVRGSILRDNIDVQFRPAADLKVIMDGLNDHRPQVVHFSGHSNAVGIDTDDGNVEDARAQELSYELLARALKATDSPPQVVVLNSCESSGARKNILKAVPILVSMRTTVSDIAATAFASRFYAAIASGQSVKAAFDQGAIAVEATSLGEKHTPEIFAQAGVDLGKLILT